MKIVLEITQQVRDVTVIDKSCDGHGFVEPFDNKKLNQKCTVYYLNSNFLQD